MFGGFANKFSLIARKVMAAPAQIGAWRAWFVGRSILNPYSTSYSGDYFDTTSAGKFIPILGGKNPTPERWRMVDIGRPHSFGIKENGTLWFWGSAFAGENAGVPTPSSSPVQIGTDTDWVDVKRRRRSAMALKSDGTLWSWGQICGDGTTTNSSPVQIGSAGEWKSIHTGGKYCSFAIKKNGTLWSWGNNSLGNLAQPYTFCEHPVQIGTDTNWSTNVTKTQSAHTLVLKTDGTLWGWGNNGGANYFLSGASLSVGKSSVPVQIYSSTWSKVSLAGSHGLGIKTGGTLWAWGRNNLGQLGLSDITDRSSPVQIGTGTDWASLNDNNSNAIFQASFAIKTNGTLWVWGLNTSGQLGLGNTTNRSSPVQLGTDTDWASVIHNSRTVFALKTNGSLWAWGLNSNGMLGLGNTVGRSSPVRVGTDTNWSKISVAQDNNVSAIKTDGTLWAWGLNSRGELGIGNTTNRSSPVQVGVATDWHDTTMQQYCFFALKATGSTSNQIWVSGLKTWGTGVPGRFSLFGGGNVSSIMIAPGLSASGQWERVFSANGGDSIHLIGIKTNGTMWSWGSRVQGYSAGFTGFDNLLPKQVGTETNWKQVSANAYSEHTLATTTDGKLFGWGRNYRYGGYGMIGSIGARSFSSPVQVGTGTNWKYVNANALSGLATKTDGTLWSWGGNGSGQLGLGDTISRSSPVQVGANTDWDKPVRNTETSSIFCFKPDKTLWSWGRQQDGNLGHKIGTNISPLQIGTSTDWTSKIAVAGTLNRSVTAIKNDGTIWAWGNNLQGQLGLGDVTIRSSPVQIGTDNNWDKVDSKHGECMSAVKTNGTLWTWGGGANGKLGHGNVTSRSSPVQVGTDTDWSVCSITKDFTMAIKTTGTLWGWGRNSVGNLGRGNTVTTSSPVQVGTGATGDWAKVSCSSYNINTEGNGYNPFTMAIKTNGTLWAWGSNVYGQLGLGNTTTRSSPVQVGTGTNWRDVYVQHMGQQYPLAVAIKTDGTMWGWGRQTSRIFQAHGVTSNPNANFSSPVQLGSASDWDSMFDVRRLRSAKKTNGTLWAWGDISSVIPYSNRGVSKVIQVRAGETGNWLIQNGTGFGNNFQVKNNGSLWFQGNHSNGLEAGSLTGPFFGNLSSPVQIGSDTWEFACSAGYEGLAGSNWFMALRGLT